jgi:glutamate--cysteine ligase catalytic subunit
LIYDVSIYQYQLADIFKVEYLVVTYDKDDEKVLLSLRQAEILTALASDQELAEAGGCTDDTIDDATKGKT